MQNWLKRLNAIQVLTLGYVFLIVLCTLLLLLPFSRTAEIPANILDELFTATSVITTTGLVLHDTGAYTLFGQLVILSMIQIAGLGYMSFIALVILLTSGQLGFSGRRLLRESVGRPTSLDLYNFIRLLLVYSIAVEAVLAFPIAVRLASDMPLHEAIYSAIFHAVSAYCTAGFSLYADSLSAYANDPVINICINLLMALGAIGYFVMFDVKRWLIRVFRQKTPRRLAVHSLFTVLVSLAIYVLASLVIWLIEHLHTEAPIDLGDVIFQVISASSTAGFNTVDVGALGTGSLFVLTILMLIGGSPGSTASGVKTTTLGIMLAFLPSVFMNKSDIIVFKRRVAPQQINRAYAMMLVATILVVVGTIVLAITETFKIIPLMFEVTSALSNVGLSTGITANLTTAGKWVIILTMFAGRVGMLGLGLSIIGKTTPLKYSRPDADLIVG